VSEVGAVSSILALLSKKKPKAYVGKNGEETDYQFTEIEKYNRNLNLDI